MTESKSMTESKGVDDQAEILAKDEATKELLDAFRQKQEGKVYLSDVIDFLADEMNQRRAFAKLPFTMLFFFVFAYRVLTHEHIADSSMVQREFRGMLSGTTFEGIAFTSGHKDLGDIDTVDDIWTYLYEVVMPIFITPKDTPERDRYRVLRYNQIIGGVQLQQVRRQKRNCDQEYDMKPKQDGKNLILDGFACYPWYSESDDCFGTNTTLAQTMTGWCPDAKVPGGVGRRLFEAIDPPRRLDFIPDGGGKGGSSKGARLYPTANQQYSVYFYEYQGLEEAIKKLDTLKANTWIDVNTAWVGMRVLVLNPDLNMFVHVTVHVYLVPSGALLPHITAQSFNPEPYQFKSVIALDCAFYFLLLILLLRMMFRLFMRLKHRELKIFLKRPWNWLDMLVTVGGLVIGLLWLVLQSNLDVVKLKVMNLRMTPPEDSAYPDKVSDLHREMNVMSEYLMSYRLVIGWYTLLISLKFLESFSAQPRLALVTNTIARSGTDLLHFLIVLFMVYMAFVVAGMFLFGRRIWEFSSMEQAMLMCGRILLGDFDWGELSEEHFWTTLVWFWSFIILLMQIMFNMLMAIIMDNYTSVKSDAGLSDYVWTQSYNVFKEFLHTRLGKSISTSKVLQYLKNNSEEIGDEIDVETLIKVCDGKLEDVAAEHIINATRERVDFKINGGVTISRAMTMIGWVKIQIQKIGWKLEDIMQEEREEHDMMRQQSLAAAAAAHQHAHGKNAHEPEAQTEPKLFLDRDGLLGELEGKMDKMETFINESMQFTSFRGKDLRNRLAVIEDLIRSQRDASSLQTERDIWETPAPSLTGMRQR